MLIRIDSSTGVPIWQQIVQQVTRQVMSAAYVSGERLPTVRELAAELRVNPNTVARAYQDLERDGIVETRRGLGTFACDLATSQPPAGRIRLIADRIDELLREAQNLQIDSEQLMELFEERLRRLEPADRTEQKLATILSEKVGR